MKKLLLVVAVLFSTAAIFAQDIPGDRRKTVEIDGNILTQIVTEEGDTLLLANLNDISISSPRTFKNRDEYLLYMKYRRYALVVYPYAKEAIRIFRETEWATTEMKDRERKRYIRKLQRELEEKFEDPLKNLTRTQGYILVKMVERELDTNMYDLIKGLRGGFTASYWSTFSRFYGFQLKDGYIIGNDPILDVVLQDFDISYKF
ncbi:MAG: DUF4294 domain-containing protein [Saprospirales bacterium]|nr:DUF4294 domain-containing protein [Saprospirales bacterium]MBK8490035.1 DUF4294 domain-containing protein [Saprospirales bacterium]